MEENPRAFPVFSISRWAWEIIFTSALQRKIFSFLQNKLFSISTAKSWNPRISRARKTMDFLRITCGPPGHLHGVSERRQRAWRGSTGSAASVILLDGFGRSFPPSAAERTSHPSRYRFGGSLFINVLFAWDALVTRLSNHFARGFSPPAQQAPYNSRKSRNTWRRTVSDTAPRTGEGNFLQPRRMQKKKLPKGR